MFLMGDNSILSHRHFSAGEVRVLADLWGLAGLFPAAYPDSGASPAACSRGIFCIITAKTAVPMRLIAPPK